MNTKLATKTLNFIQLSSALVKRALDELSVHRASQEKAATLREDLLNQMLAVGAVGAHQKQAAEAMLGSHAETMSLLKLAVDKIATMKEQLQKASVDIGQGVDEKEAGVKTAADFDSLTDPYVGRKTGKRKASDEAILAVLNG